MPHTQGLTAFGNPVSITRIRNKRKLYEALRFFCGEE